MRREIDKIEIEEPPIEKLRKKRSCAKRACFNGCGCVVLLFIISLILLKFALGPKSKELKDLPKEFTDNIQIYDVDSIKSITYTPGKERSKNLEILAYLPKIIISPMVLWMEREKKESNQINNFEKIIRFIKKPIADHRDIIKIEWMDLAADNDFIDEYYKAELQKKDFYVGLESKNQQVSQFTFDKDGINGVLYINDITSTEYTDYMSLTINMDLGNKI